MTSYYKYLPMKTIQRSKLSLKKRQTRHYLFALLLLLVLIFMCLYEFYFTIMERAKTGKAEANILERIVCQVFMLSVCPNKEPKSALSLRKNIEYINKAQVVRNFADQQLTEESIVVVIQVYQQQEYLKELIQSLSCIPDADSMFLIFSHDYFDEDIDLLVKSIDFAPVLQIYFPFSIQLFPDEFPGTGPNDCPWNLDVAEAKTRQCEGAQTPDQNGHFRQSEVTQTKHHWWWTFNTVFERLDIIHQFNGFVLFLEEGQYVAPDILHTLRLMTYLAATQCPECNSFHLSNPKGSQLYKVETNKVEVAPWNSMGFAFNRGMWQVLRACSNVFCTFDDANWAWSYKYAAQECFFHKLTTLVVRVSRVLQLCESNSNTLKKEDCDLKISLHEAKTQITTMKPYMFPEGLILESTNWHQPHVRKGWGGWSDPRDIQLCHNLTAWDPISNVEG